MNFLPHILLLVFLGAFTLSILAFYKWLEKKETSSRLRLAVLRTGIALVILAPIAFIILQVSQWQSVEVRIPALASMGLGQAAAGPMILYRSQTHWTVYIAAAYLAGLLFMLARIGISYWNAKKLIARAKPGVVDGHVVYLSESIASPFSFGFLNPAIYVPAILETDFSKRSIEMTLAHEAVHIKNQDPLWRVLSLITRAILYIFPWSYSLHRIFELETELQCDYETQKLTDATPQEYGHLLLSMTLKLPINQLLTNITDTTIKRRILAMKSRKIHRPILTYIGSLVLIVSAILGVAVTSGATERKDLFQLNAAISVNGKVVASPMIQVFEGDEGNIIVRDENDHVLSLVVKMQNAVMPNSSSAIGIDMDLRYQREGKEIHSTPKIIVAEGQKGSIGTEDDFGANYEIEVLATRIK